MSEFKLINHVFKPTAIEREDVLLGIGDDCALLSPPTGLQLALSTDTLISGVHFPAITCAEDIGYKSLAVNLSDLAAMGAEPAWASLAITLPEADTPWAVQFMQGFNTLASQYNVSLIGGDTTQGPLSITVNVTGFVPAERALKRSRAQVGDLIFVTGTIGDAFIGLNAILDNAHFTPHKGFTEAHLKHCIARLNRPTPRVDAGRALCAFNVAAIDISDGLLADLAHICHASSRSASSRLASNQLANNASHGMGAIVNLEQIPLSDALQHYYHSAPDWSRILSAGDDYELCFTCSSVQAKEMMPAIASLGVQVRCIGEITDQPTVVCQLNGEVININQSGYNHF